MKYRPLLALALASALLPHAAGQQQPPSQPQPQPLPGQPRQTPTPSAEQDEVVRITSNLIQLDVIVIDKSGRPVTDLRSDEFEVFEDGRPQEITNFSYISTAPAGGATPATTARAGATTTAPAPPPPPVRLRPEQVRRTVALVVDDLGLSFESMHFVRNSLRKFVSEQMQEGDLVAIIRTGAGVGALQQFTSDKRLLSAAIDGMKWNSYSRGGVAAFAPIEDDPSAAPKFSSTGGSSSGAGGGELQKAMGLRDMVQGAAGEDPVNQRAKEFREEVFSVGTLGALNYVVRGLREMPGRKSVVLMSDSMTLFNPGSGSRMNDRTVQAIQRLTDLANRASVVIYTIDPRGVPPMDLAAMDNLTGMKSLPLGNRMSRPVPAMSGVGMMEALNQRSSAYVLSQEGLHYLANQTGGFFFHDNNDLNLGLKRVLDDQRGFYLIGYRPSEETFDPKTGRWRFHHVGARVRREGLTVRMRSGFFGVSNEEARNAATRTPAQRMMTALTSPFAAGDIDMRLTSIFLNEPDYGPYVRSFIHVGGGSLTFKDLPDGSHEAAVDVMAVTFDVGGMPVDQRVRTETVRVRGDEYRTAQERGLIFSIRLPVQKAGAFQLRVAVRDVGSGRVGAANQFIEVPNLGKGRLTLSGIYLAGVEIAAAGAREGGGGEGKMVAAFDPQASPAVRRFPAGTLVEYGYEVYNARLDKTTKRPRLLSQVRLFRDNRQVFNGRVTELSAPPDAKRLTALGRIQLGANHGPGEYVLQVVVTDTLAKETQRMTTQWIEFEIR